MSLAKMTIFKDVSPQNTHQNYHYPDDKFQDALPDQEVQHCHQLPPRRDKESQDLPLCSSLPPPQPGHHHTNHDCDEELS